MDELEIKRRSAYLNNLDILMDKNARIVILIASFIALLYNGLALIALLRTRKTPKRARFLSSALLVFDFLSTLFYTVRKVVVPPEYNLLCQLLALGCSYSAYLNIAIMSLERLLYLQWPLLYLRYIRFSVIKIFSVVIWGLYQGIWSFQCVQCYLQVSPANMESYLCFELAILRHAMIVFTLSALVSCYCLVSILRIIKKQNTKMPGNKGKLRLHKSTMCVLICCGNYLVTTIWTVILTFCVQENVIRRIVIDIVLTVNGFVDTSVYVLWYKECRLQLLKMMSVMCPFLKRRVEEMRISVFEIRTFKENIE